MDANEERNTATVGFVIDLSTIFNRTDSGHYLPAAGARETICRLQNSSIPFVITAIKTKVTETEVARWLSAQLGLGVNRECITLPQSPFRTFASTYKGRTILAVGSQEERVRRFALNYGFEHVLTCKDIASRKHRGQIVSAIFVFWVPNDWDRDTRTVIDMLLSDHGRVGTRFGGSLDERFFDTQPTLYICMADTSAAGHQPVVRGGKTWFDTLLKRWREETGGLPLEYYACGMGCDGLTIHTADKVLNVCNQNLHPNNRPFPRTIYMIGADIGFGRDTDKNPIVRSPSSRRRSIRVDVNRLGLTVHDFDPLLRPWHVAKSLEKAVEYALLEEYWDCIEAGLTPLFPKPESAETSLL